MAGIRDNVVEIGQVVSPDRYGTLARYAVLYDEMTTATVTVTADYQITELDHTIFAKTVDMVLTLPDATQYPGRQYQIKNANSGGDITLTSLVGTIDNQASIVVANLDSLVVKSDGADWWIFNSPITAGSIPGKSQYLGAFTTATRPDPVASKSTFWITIQDPGQPTKDFICHKNSDGTFSWVPRSSGLY